MVWDRAVNSSYAVGFDGTDDYIAISHAAALSSTELTISFWTKNNVTPAQFDGILGKTNGSNWTTGWGFYYDSATTLRAFCGSSASQYINATINPLMWNHVVLTITTTTTTLYINGRPIGTAGVGTYNTTNALDIGRLGTNSYNINGLIDDFRIYNRALTAAEIQSTYRNSSSPPTLGLVCYFPLDEGTGTTVTDTVGSLTGTLTNGPTWQTQVSPRLKSGRDVTARSKAYSLSFDGTNDYISIGNVAALDFERTSTFSVSVWFKLSSTSGRQFLVSKEGHADPWRGWAVEYNYTGSDNQIQFDLVNSGSNLSSVRTSGQSFAADVWYHVLATNAGTGVSGMKIYINGVEASTTTPYNTLGANTIVNSASVSLGSNNNAALFLNGSLRDARIYNSVLTAANAKTLAIGGDVSGAVGKWELNEGTGTTATDTGSGGNNGTLTPNPTGGPTWSNDVPQWWRQDRHTWSLACDGSNDWVSVAHNAVHCPATAITVSAWVKPTAGAGGGNQGIVCKSNSATNGWILYRAGPTGNEAWYFAIHRNASSLVQAAGGPGGQLNVWYHVAGTYDSSTGNVKAYVNGVLVSTVSTTGSITASTTAISIGNLYTVGQHFPGNIKDARVYDSALSSSDIVKLANNVPVTTMPVGHWPLDEGTGTTAIDKSGTGNNGTLTNGPTYTGDLPQHMRRTIESSHAGSFDGTNDYINLGSDATIDNLASADFTVTSWINLAGSPAAGLNFRILDKSNVSGLSGWEMYVHDTNRYLSAFVDMGTSDAYYLSNVSLALSTWYPVAGVWSSSANTFKLYNAGVETTYSTSTAGSGTKPDDSAHNLSIGALAPLGARYFNGLIDEVCFYRRALTAAELADIAAGYLVSAGLISRYKLDGNANDSYGSNHGTPQGGVSYSSAVPATIAKRPRRSGLPFA